MERGAVSCNGWAAAAALVLILLKVHSQAPSTALVPAIITFGDSTVDVGNNNHLSTIFKANFPPYGRDFKNHEATGRFCNGKLATDITAETLGFTTLPAAYLSPEASGKNLLIGANFASAASGYYEHTAMLYQLEYYKEYQSKLAGVAGSTKAATILSQALYILSTGSGDFVQNYYINPYLYKVYSPDEFSSILVGTNLYTREMERRRQGVAGAWMSCPSPESRNRWLLKPAAWKNRKSPELSPTGEMWAA